MATALPSFRVARKDLFGKQSARTGTVWLQADAQPDVCIKPATLAAYFGKDLSAQDCRSLTLTNEPMLNRIIAETTPQARAKKQGKRMVAEVTLADLTAASVKLSDTVLATEWPYMF